MNILFISPNSPQDSIGGVERYISNLIDYCKTKSNGKIYIMLPTSKDNYTETDGSVTIYYENGLSVSKNHIGIQKEISLKSRIFADRVKKIIQSDYIEIICAENFHVGLPAAFSLLLNMVASIHSIPLILRLHSFAVKDLQKELVNQLMWRRISCVSKSITGDCFDKGANINVLSTDYLGVNTSEFNTESADTHKLKKELGLPPEKKIILTAGRIIVGKKSIIKEKGFINLIQAFSQLSPRFKNLTLLIAVAKAPDNLQDEFNTSLQMLHGYIKLNHIERNTIVKMFGLHEMPYVYRGSDMFVLPSENETFGQVFIESMACGLPVIGTKVGGIPEIISDSYNGYLVNPDDSSRLAQRIEEIITNDIIRKEFIKAGIKTVHDTFTATNQFDIFFEKLERIVASSN